MRDSMRGWGLVQDPLFNGGFRTKHDFPNSVRDPMRDHGVQRGNQDIERDPDIRAGSTTREHRCRAGPGLPCGGQSGILDPVRNPEFRPSSNAGSFTCDVFHSVRYPTLSWLRSQGGALWVGYPLV